MTAANRRGTWFPSNNPSSSRSTVAVEKLQNSQSDFNGSVEVGFPVPDFLLSGCDGKVHRLSDFRGRKVMLCFYRHSACPTCAYTVAKFIGHYKKLAWASKLTVITVFQTDVESLREGLTDADAPIRRLTGISESGYPFLGLADPDGTAASSFHVNKREFARWNAVFSSGIHFLHHREESTLLPSEFLIDEAGRLADVMRAKKREETMALFRVNQFLSHGFKPKVTRSSDTN